MQKNPHRIHVALLAALVAVIGTQTLPAQDTPTIYSHSRCWKAHPGKRSQMQEFFTQHVRTMAEVGVAKGQYAAYSVLRAVTPNGSDNDCDFIATTRWVGYPESLAVISDEGFAKLGMERPEFGEKLRNAGSLVRTNMWRGVDRIGAGKEGAYVVIDLMKTKNAADWEEVEQTVFKPMHQARLDAGDTLAWGAGRLIMPRGTSLEYDAVTYSVYPDFKAAGKRPRFPQLFERIHAGKDWQKAVERTLASREIVRSNMYRSIVAVNPN